MTFAVDVAKPVNRVGMVVERAARQVAKQLDGSVRVRNCGARTVVNWHRQDAEHREQKQGAVDSMSRAWATRSLHDTPIGRDD